jgi:hypothetical protein
MSRAATRSRERQRRSTAPLRIRVDKRPTDYTDAYSCVWYVSPVERDVRGEGNWEWASYELEIHLSGQYDDGMEIKRTAYKDGEHYTCVSDAEFAELVQTAVEHGEDEEGVRDRLAERHVWPLRSMGVFGFNLSYFERMEDAWRAALQFLDFGYTQ